MLRATPKPNRFEKAKCLVFHNVNKCERSERNTGVHLTCVLLLELVFDGFTF